MPRTVNILAPAKLNLALSVGPPAPEFNGFHPIASWMMTVDLFDELTLTRLDPGTLSRYAILWHKDAKRRSEINWSLTKDLAVRAHLALEKHLDGKGIPGGLPVQMKLAKRIPVGGGLGGGSANAAAMLRGLNELFDLNLPHDELAGIGASLGSDVPFLVHGGSAIVEGLGERLTPHAHDQTPMLHAVIAFPDAHCATPRVYGLFDELHRDAAALRSDDVHALSKWRPRLAPDAPFNDLAEPAMLAAPQLREHIQELSKLADRPAHITGSGSSIFVLCDDEMHAIALADAVERKLHLPVVAVKTVRV